MVNLKAAQLDRTFAALADPTRRALLARLEGTAEGLSVSALAAPLAMSLPAVMKHLAVLDEAGLVTRRKQGRQVTCRLAAAPMEEAMAWLARYQRFWSGALDRLAAVLEEESPCSPRPRPARRRSSTAPAASPPASPSRSGSRPRRRGSGRPGPSRAT